LDKRLNQIGLFINPPVRSTGHHRTRQLEGIVVISVSSGIVFGLQGNPFWPGFDE
jgi:hypothetical protein